MGTKIASHSLCWAMSRRSGQVASRVIWVVVASGPRLGDGATALNVKALAAAWVGWRGQTFLALPDSLSQMTAGTVAGKLKQCG